MKEKLLIYQADPCLMSLEDPAIQTVPDAQARGQTRCRYYAERQLCSPPRFDCVKVAGLRVARRVLEYHGESTEETLTMEIEHFGKTAPMPTDKLEAYVDTSEFGCRYITDPGLVLQRVAEYARKVLDLKPGERIFRGTKDPLHPNSHWKNNRP